MIPEVVQSPEIDILHTDTLVLDQYQYHVIDVTTLALDIVIEKQNLFLKELHHVQNTLDF